MEPFTTIYHKAAQIVKITSHRNSPQENKACKESVQQGGQQTMGSNCARTDITHRTTTTETHLTYDNTTWHAINTGYINSTKETASVFMACQIDLS